VVPKSTIEELVISTLVEFGIPHEIIHIDPACADTAAFCQQYGYSIDICGNTIVVASKREPKQYSACVVRGSDRLDVNRAVKKLMGVSRLSFASAEETESLTGMTVGGVTPFALPAQIPVYADEALLTLDYVILGSGSRSSKVKIAPETLKKLPGAQFVSGLSLHTQPPQS
jgi:prolyl-tRNA editing enzyme YbaK/EbsC (Cys-tRNA(Pro) deacylase)